MLSLKVTLRHVKAPVWRRILVKDGMSPGGLHMAIQICTGGWIPMSTPSTSAASQNGNRTTTADVSDERRLTLNGLVKSGVARFTHTYDFGDDWEHDIRIEKALAASKAKAFPACVAGKRACPPEDCGGPFAYQDLLAVPADPATPATRNSWNGWVGSLIPRQFQ